MARVGSLITYEDRKTILPFDLLLDHVVGDELREVGRAHDEKVGSRPPVVVAELEEPAGLGRAGHVDEGVDSSEVRDRRLHDVLEVGLRREVAEDAVHLPERRQPAPGRVSFSSFDELITTRAPSFRNAVAAP